MDRRELAGFRRSIGEGGEGERRHARHRRSVRERAPLILGRGALLAIVGVGLTMVGPNWVLLGWALVLLAVVSTAAALFIDPPSVRARSIGAEGEVRTSDLLAPLADRGFVILADRRRSSGRPNTGASVGYRWVNLRFAIEDDRALLRYEAKPDGEPLPPGRAPAFNGGFDIHRIIGRANGSDAENGSGLGKVRA